MNSCGSCQNCCQGTIVRATEEDVIRWKKENRYDVILCLESLMGSDLFLIHKKDKDECIFLTEQGCEIYATRPLVCRDFPKSQDQIKKYSCKLVPITHKVKV